MTVTYVRERDMTDEKLAELKQEGFESSSCIFDNRGALYVFCKFDDDDE